MKHLYGFEGPNKSMFKMVYRPDQRPRLLRYSVSYNPPPTMIMLGYLGDVFGDVFKTWWRCVLDFFGGYFGMRLECFGEVWGCKKPITNHQQDNDHYLALVKDEAFLRGGL